MIKKDNMKLPAPNEYELSNYRKWAYSDRMWKEESNEKYGLTPGEFAMFISRTYNEYSSFNKHITYRESLK